MGESILRDRGDQQQSTIRRALVERESGQDSGTRMWIFDGDVSEVGDAGEGPGKSFLFSLTVYHPEIKLFGDRVQ